MPAKTGNPVSSPSPVPSTSAPQLAGLSTNAWAVLAFLGEGQAHGFKVASAFSKKSALGAAWTLQRPQIYRALEQLEDKQLIAAIGCEPSDQGPPRTLYAITTLGQHALQRWLYTPVQHLRNARSELLLKLLFLERYQFDPQPLLHAQHRRFSEIEQALRAKAQRARGTDIVLQWRIEVVRAALTFLERRQH